MQLAVFLVMLMWTLDKFINLGHAGKIFEKFYFIAGLERTVLALLAGLELLILTGFLMGFYKRLCYGVVLALNTVSRPCCPINNIYPLLKGLIYCFFSAWPMLAGCLMLYLLRDEDVILSLNR